MTHWKTMTDAEYIGAYAFQPGQEMTLTIDHVVKEEVTGNDGKKKHHPIAYFKEHDVKPMVLNNTNCKAIELLYGTPDITQWRDKQIIVKVQKVRAFGEMKDALRVKPELPPKPEEIKCSKCGHALIGVGQMNARALADYTRKKFGVVLCAECGKKEADAQENTTEEKTEEKTE